MAIEQPVLDVETGDSDPMDAADIQDVTTERLNAIVGGDWWQRILREKHDFVAEVQRITDGYCDRLRERFCEVYDHPIKADWRHTTPKYSLIFGSRSSDATVLMNDAIVKSRELWAEETADEPALFFEVRPTEVVPDLGEIRPLIMRVATEKMTRAELILRTIRSRFGMYSETQIRRGITELIKSRMLASETGRHRINDREHVWPISG